MKKRIFCLLLTVVMVFTLLPIGALAYKEGYDGMGPQKITGKRDFSWPVPGKYNIRSYFYDHREHYALDISAAKGTSVVASYDGIVLKAVYEGTDYYGDGFGNYVVLKHSYKLLNGNTVTLYSRYSHLNSVSVSKGQKVSAGTVIGKIGESGKATGPHLDFQILYGGWSSYKKYSIDPYSNDLLVLPASLKVTDGYDCGESYFKLIKDHYATKYMVKYNANGGTCAKCGKLVTKDNTIGTLPTPEYGDYPFAGWYTAKSGGTKVTSTTEITADTTIYAHWSSIKGTVGENVNWTLSTAGTLTLSGSGATYDYESYKDVPWYNYRSSIKKIVVNDGVTYIGVRVFAYCTKATSVTIAGSVKIIGQYAFYHCTALTSAPIPEGVDKIGSYAFAGCTVLGDISFPTTLTALGDCVCSGCTALTSVTIPANVTSIGFGPFGKCTALKTIEVAEGNNNFTIVDGLLVGDNYKVLQCPGAKTGAIVLPEGITRISSSAFNECKNITEVTLTKDITVKSYAFYGCTSLKTVHIKSGTKEVGANCFKDCTALETVYFDGTQAQWDEFVSTIVSSENNEPLLNAKIIVDDHSYVEEVTAPTCTEKGYTTYNCECGDSYVKDYVDALGHDCVNGVCTRCGGSDPEFFSITSQPTDTSANIGNTVYFKVSAKGEGLSYQWQYSKNNGKTWLNSTSASAITDAISVKATATRDGQMYRCVVKDCYGNTVTSEAVKLTIGTESTSNIEITQQPENVSTAVGEKAVFTVAVQGEGHSYQWQYSTNGGKGWKDSTMTGYNTDTLTVKATATRDGQQYRCVITDANGNTITSDAVTLTVS